MSKIDLCSNFDADINRVLNDWINNRVIPYSNAYSAALQTYNRTLARRTQDLKQQRELLMVVASVVAIAAIEFAPVAAALSSASRAFQGAALLRVANVVGRSSFITRHRAFGMLKAFTYGPVSNLVSGLATGPGKSAIQRHLDSAMQSTNTGGAQSAGPQSELMHRNALESTVRTSALQLQQLGQLLRDTHAITENDTQLVINGVLQHSNFFQHTPTSFAGDHILARRSNPPTMPDQQDLSRRFEKTLWATWCLGLETQVSHTIRYFDEFGVRDPNGGRSYTTTEYSDAGSAALGRMQQLGVRINGQGINDFVGWIETDSEVRQTISWAQVYLRSGGVQTGL